MLTNYPLIFVGAIDYENILTTKISRFTVHNGNNKYIHLKVSRSVHFGCSDLNEERKMREMRENIGKELGRCVCGCVYIF